MNRTTRTTQTTQTIQHVPPDWEQPAADRYARTIPLKIPGYDSLQEMMNRLLTMRRESGSAAASMLIVGAGGGQECIALGAAVRMKEDCKWYTR